jgi:murein DD-endopeptidase MepM/ murein hydrolase activator NlpD
MPKNGDLGDSLSRVRFTSSLVRVSRRLALYPFNTATTRRIGTSEHDKRVLPASRDWYSVLQLGKEGYMVGLIILGIAATAGTALILSRKQQVADAFFAAGGTLPGASKSPRQRQRYWQPVQDVTGPKATHVADQGRFGRGLIMGRVTAAGTNVPHWGIDIVAPEGTPIRSAKSGVVRRAGPMSGYGNTVIIEHSSDRTVALYAHLSRVGVREGQNVLGGQVIGLMGRSSAGPDGVVPSWGRTMGSHLHMEMHQSYPPDLRSGAQAAHRQGVINPEQWLLREGIAMYANYA